MKLKNLYYGWIIVVIGVFVLMIQALPIYTFGIFLRPLTMEFNWDRGALSGAYSMFALINGLLFIPRGRLSDKYGPRILVTISGLLYGIGFLLMSLVNSLWQVYIIFGLLMGIGGGCLYIAVTSTIPRWFAKSRGVAVGLTVTGTGIGGITSALLAQWLISSYGWQQAYLILGLITVIIIIPAAQFMKHSPQRAGLRPYGEDITIEDKQPSDSPTGELFFNQVIKTGRFWLLGSIVFCDFFVVQVIITHIVPHAVDTGISAMVAASILSIICAISLIGRSLIGFVCDRIGTKLTLTAFLVIITVTLIWLLFAKETWMFYVFAVIFGFAPGGIFPIATLIVTNFLVSPL